MTHSVLNFVSYVAAEAFAIVCVFEGVRRITAHGLSKYAVLSVTLGLLYFVSYAGLSCWGKNVQHNASAALRRGLAVPETPTELGQNFSTRQRADVSLELARAAFYEHGQFRYYFDEAGKRTVFTPSQTELEKRASKFSQLALVDFASDKYADSRMEWLFSAIFAALFGFIYGRRQTNI